MPSNSRPLVGSAIDIGGGRVQIDVPAVGEGWIADLVVEMTIGEAEAAGFRLERDGQRAGTYAVFDATPQRTVGSTEQTEPT